jgi:GNAT superfamily N-acetyltransferase
MNPILHFRLIKKNELQDLINLYDFLNPNDYPLPPDSEINEVWKEIYEDNHFKCFIAEIDNLIVASCTLSIIPNLTRGARPYAVMENVIVQPDYRRKGIGTQLLKYCINYAWSQKCYKIMLMTRRKDEGITKFYTRAGFIKGIKTAFLAKNYPS